MPDGLPRFYVYSHPSLDHAWLSSCAGFEALASSAHARFQVEVGLSDVLRRHPLRTRDAAQATLFYVPIFEYTSLRLGNIDTSKCAALGARKHAGAAALSTHGERMVAASRALVSSAHWLRSAGRDHFFATTSFNHPAPLSTRMLPLSKVLRCAIAGRYKGFLFGYKRSAKSSVGICAIEMPYTGPRQAALAQSAARAVLSSIHRNGSGASASGIGSGNGGDTANFNVHAGRPTLLYFAGALDVCCYGRDARCAVGKLKVAALHDEAVVIRPQLPVDGHPPGPCLLKMQQAQQQVQQQAKPETSTSLLAPQQPAPMSNPAPCRRDENDGRCLAETRRELAQAAADASLVAN